MTMERMIVSVLLSILRVMYVARTYDVCVKLSHGALTPHSSRW